MAQRYFRPSDYNGRKIAPRLASGDSRESLGHGLPPAIKEGLKRIAAQQGRSLSWILEEIIIDHFKLRRPVYMPPKPKPEDRAKARESERDE